MKRQTEFLLHFYMLTSGAGSRASAELFVGSYEIVDFTLVLVGTQFERVNKKPF